MSLRGVKITEGTIGANVAGDNREFALIANGVAVPDKLELDKLYTLRRPSDAEAIGLNAAYDTTNKVNVYRHITEFYRRAGEGKILHVMLVAQTVMLADMPTSAKVLVVESGGAVSDIVFAFNPAAEYTPTIVDGMDENVYDAITELQAFADWCESQDMPLHTILECRGLADAVDALPNLRALPNGFEGSKVTVVCGQDWEYANGLAWDLGKNFADVGTFLGVVASQQWNRNPGEVATQNLTNATQKIWLTGGLSNHKKYSQVYDQLETMNDKGFVFPIRYQGTAGYFWNNGHCCIPIVLDASGRINQHMIYYSHTINESIRSLRISYLPEVKKPVELSEGKLPQDMVDYYNAVGDNAFDRLASAGLISDGVTSVDPDSDLLIEKILKVQFAVVPTGMVDEIVGTINLVTS